MQLFQNSRSTIRPNPTLILLKPSFVAIMPHLIFKCLKPLFSTPKFLLHPLV